MQFWILAFFGGICWVQCFSYLPSLWWIGLIIPLFIGCFLQRIDFKRNIFYMVLGECNKISNILLAFALGFVWALIYAHWLLSWTLSSNLENKNLLINGYIASLPQTDSKVTTFVFATQQIAAVNGQTKLKLSWYGAHPHLTAGDRWQLLVRLKRPHGVLNPGGFDVEQYLYEHHIRATGYVVNDVTVNQLLASHWYSYPLARWRQQLETRMLRALFYKPLSGIIVALVTGDESKITESQWQIFRTTGTSYLVAISGLHIGLVAGMFFKLVQFLWCRSKILPLILPATQAATLGALAIALIYSAVSGFSIPTQRSLIMLSIFLGALWFRRHMLSWNSFCLALFVVLIINPIAVLNIGFWLSFTAIAVIIYVSSGRKHFINAKKSFWVHKIKHHGHKFWRLQYAITFGLLPLTLLLFQQVSLTAIITNIVAMPVVCLIVVPLSLLGALLLALPGYFGGWLLWLAQQLLQLVWCWLNWWSNLGLSSWQHPIFNIWILIAASIGIVILLAPRYLPGKFIGILWLLPLCCYLPPGPKDGAAWFTVLDVGQGLASVVRTAKHTLIYDTGIKFFTTDSGTAVVLPFLASNGVSKVDTLIISHGDNDHIGGANSILASIPVKQIVTSVPQKFIQSNVFYCYHGQTWMWDNVTFKILAPERYTEFAGNNASCILQVSVGKRSILLTGDMEKDAENSLLNNNPDLKTAILVAPHHGSATSSTKALVAATNPQWVVFPVGYRNRFHFPAKSIVKRYQDLGAQLLSTANSGAISFQIDSNSAIMAPILFREVGRRYWNDR